MLEDGPEERRERLVEQRGLLTALPEDETASFQDEVDVNANPEVGTTWMRPGHQADVLTPGDREKRYLFGSIHCRSGGVFLTEGRPEQRREESLFQTHPDDVRRRLRHYRENLVICDDAKFRKDEAVTIHPGDHRDRIEIRFLPRRSPDCNPIERLREPVPLNLRCRSLKSYRTSPSPGWAARRASRSGTVSVASPCHSFPPSRGLIRILRDPPDAYGLIPPGRSDPA